LADDNGWWTGDVNGRFSPLVFVKGRISVVIEEEDEEKDTRSKGGGGAGEANSWWTPLVAAVARDRNVIPYLFGGGGVVVNGYWSINCESRSSLKSNEEDVEETPLVGGHGAWRQRHTPLPHKRRVCGNVDEGTSLVGTTAVVDVVVVLDVDEHESVDFFV
jgi:hypothetical protein